MPLLSTVDESKHLEVTTDRLKFKDSRCTSVEHVARWKFNVSFAAPWYPALQMAFQ